MRGAGPDQVLDRVTKLAGRADLELIEPDVSGPAGMGRLRGSVRIREQPHRVDARHRDALASYPPLELLVLPVDPAHTKVHLRSGWSLDELADFIEIGSVNGSFVYATLFACQLGAFGKAAVDWGARQFRG